MQKINVITKSKVMKEGLLIGEEKYYSGAHAITDIYCGFFYAALELVLQTRLPSGGTAKSSV